MIIRDMLKLVKNEKIKQERARFACKHAVGVSLVVATGIAIGLLIGTKACKKICVKISDCAENTVENIKENLCCVKEDIEEGLCCAKEKIKEGLKHVEHAAEKVHEDIDEEINESKKE